jgi:hypothetical protein
MKNKLIQIEITADYCITPECRDDLLTLGSVRECKFNPDTKKMIEFFYVPKDVNEAIEFILDEELPTLLDLDDEKSSQIKAILLSGEKIFNPRYIPVYEQLGLQPETLSDNKDFIVISNRTIDLQLIPSKFLKLTLEWAFIRLEVQLIEDVLLQLEELDLIDDEMNKFLIQMTELMIMESFYVYDIPHLKTTPRLSNLINQANLETDFTGYTSDKVSMLVISKFRTQKEFDKLIDSFGNLLRGDELLTDIKELVLTIGDESKNVIRMLTTNSKTSDLLKRELYFTVDVPSLIRRFNLREFVSDDFRKWMLKEGYIHPEP